MKNRQLVAFVLCVLLPLGAALLFGIRSFAFAQMEAENRFSEFLFRHAQGLVASYQDFAGGFQDDFSSAASQLFDPAAGVELTANQIEGIRALSEDHPLLRQVFFLDRDGSLIYPDAENPSSREAAFLDRAAGFLDLGWRPAEPDSGAADAGWVHWYWREGIQLIYWVPAGEGYLCFELNRSALMAELTGFFGNLLSDSVDEAGVGSGRRYRISDGQGELFAQWGSLEDEGPVESLAVPLGTPLDGWNLEFSMDPALWEDRGKDGRWSLVAALLGLVGAAAFLVVYTLRELRRDLREAGQRISFVNQVSHELKSPLTNIRLYADLLESGLPEGQSREREYAGVIQREGRRLGRLIHNVLSFGRKEKNDGLEPREADLDETLRLTLESFAVSFAEKGIRVETALNCPGPRSFDPDAVDQIVGNLLSNAEKYARSGGSVRVESRCEGSAVFVSVRDWGPGLPAGAEKTLFQPFERFHHKLTDGVGGTGLGLFLARDLARRHGGDLEYRPAEPGCEFVLRLEC